MEVRICLGCSSAGCGFQTTKRPLISWATTRVAPPACPAYMSLQRSECVFLLHFSGHQDTLNCNGLLEASPGSCIGSC